MILRSLDASSRESHRTRRTRARESVRLGICSMTSLKDFHGGGQFALDPPRPSENSPTAPRFSTARRTTVEQRVGVGRERAGGDERRSSAGRSPRNPRLDPRVMDPDRRAGHPGDVAEERNALARVRTRPGPFGSPAGPPARSRRRGRGSLRPSRGRAIGSRRAVRDRSAGANRGPTWRLQTWSSVPGPTRFLHRLPAAQLGDEGLQLGAGFHVKPGRRRGWPPGEIGMS